MVLKALRAAAPWVLPFVCCGEEKISVGTAPLRYFCTKEASEMFLCIPISLLFFPQLQPPAKSQLLG